MSNLGGGGGVDDEIEATVVDLYVGDFEEIVEKAPPKKNVHDIMAEQGAHKAAAAILFSPNFDRIVDCVHQLSPNLLVHYLAFRNSLA